MVRHNVQVRAFLLLSAISQIVLSTTQKGVSPFDFYLERDEEQVSVFWKSGSLPKIEAVGDSSSLFKYSAQSPSNNRKVIFYLCKAEPGQNTNSFNFNDCQELATINTIQAEAQTAIFTFKTPNVVEIINQQFSVESNGEELVKVMVLENLVPPRKQIALNINVSRSAAGITLSQFVEVHDLPLKVVNFWLTDKQRQINRLSPITSIFIPKTDTDFFNLDISPLYNKYKEWGWENSKDFTISAAKSNGEKTSVDYIEDDGSHLFMIALNENVTLKLVLDVDFLLGPGPNPTKKDRLYVALHIDTPNNLEKNPLKIETFSLRKDRHYGFRYTNVCGSSFEAPCIKLDAKDFLASHVSTHKQDLVLAVPSEYVVFSYKVQSDPNLLDIIQVVHNSQGACDFENRQDSYSIRRINVLDNLNLSHCEFEFIFKDKFENPNDRFGPIPQTYKQYSDDEDFAPTTVFLEIGTGGSNDVVTMEGSIVRNNIRKIEYDGESSRTLI